ncbi:hypothetical protein ACFE04_006355 [Oxalis oulophora]
MELDPDDIFKDDEDDADNLNYQDRQVTKEFVVYLIDASPKMFNNTCPSDKGEEETHFHIAVSCVSQSLKTHIINTPYDEVAICFFNTREKKNLQDLNGVFVFNVAERDDLDRSTAKLIKEFDNIEGNFTKEIGSQPGIVFDSRENSLYNAIWVAQGLLRKGSSKTADKRVLLFTNEDDPFGGTRGLIKTDMIRTTLQRAKDAKDLGISIEILPLSRPDDTFDVSVFYADMIGLEGDDLALFMPLAGDKLENMKDRLRKRMFKKRIVRQITFCLADGLSIEVSSYALIRPTAPGQFIWLDSSTNRPLKVERSFICEDTGSLMNESLKYFYPYQSEKIMFSAEELKEIKRIQTGHLRLLGFKPLSCLKDYHNLRPSTFIFPTDKEVLGSTTLFIALHRSMIKLERSEPCKFAVAFHGSSSAPRLVALVAQDEVVTPGGQVEPPGMHMIHLPYCDDIRGVEELLSSANNPAPRATDDQIKKAVTVVKRMDLRDFSVCQLANPALQRHYEVLQAIALDEDDLPEIKDETLPDEEGLARPGFVKAVQEFKVSVYGENHNGQVEGKGVSEVTKKRKAAVENACKESENYNWVDLADGGKLKDLTVVELKYYLSAHNLPLSGKKDVLISRILSHMKNKTCLLKCNQRQAVAQMVI